MTEHFYREKDQYDMMCAAREGPTGTERDEVVVDLLLCLTRPCQAPSSLSTDLPGLISSSRDQVELSACPPVDRPPLLDVSAVPGCLGTW